jgi:signal transduction histidine kinase
VDQVFGNLVDNAVKYLATGRPGLVEISGRAVGRNAEFSVRDNGRGIAEHDMDRIFDLFRRSGVQDRPGEGIGLAHVRSLVRRMGGTISCSSTLGSGTEFRVVLPRVMKRDERVSNDADRHHRDDRG